MQTINHCCETFSCWKDTHEAIQIIRPGTAGPGGKWGMEVLVKNPHKLTQTLTDYNGNDDTIITGNMRSKIMMMEYCPFCGSKLSLNKEYHNEKDKSDEM